MTMRTAANAPQPAPLVRELHWEDLVVGMTDVSPGRTIGEADLVGFAGLSGDFNAIHMDAVHAEQLGLGGRRLVHGLLGLSIASGLFTRTAMGMGMQRQLVAMLAIEWSFRGPLRIGDTVHVEAEIPSRRETSRPDRGIVEIARTLRNQHGEAVQEGLTTMMVLRLPGGA